MYVQQSKLSDEWYDMFFSRTIRGKEVIMLAVFPRIWYILDAHTVRHPNSSKSAYKENTWPRFYVYLWMWWKTGGQCELASFHVSKCQGNVCACGDVCLFKVFTFGRAILTAQKSRQLSETAHARAQSGGITQWYFCTQWNHIVDYEAQIFKWIDRKGQNDKKLKELLTLPNLGFLSNRSLKKRQERRILSFLPFMHVKPSLIPCVLFWPNTSTPRIISTWPPSPSESAAPAQRKHRFWLWN